jgi:site-specific DNA-methyltransferase (adenine-specific)
MLGKYELNNIYNEDSYKAIDNIPDGVIDLIVIDPPYLIENTQTGQKSDFAKSLQGMCNDLESKKETLTIGITNIFLEELIRLQNKINIYIWCNHKQIPQYLDFFVTKQKCNFNILVWNKTNALPTFSNKYLTDKEYCLYFRKGGYCKPQSYEDAKTVMFDSININDKKLFNHPTIKPLQMIKKLIRNSSKENDIVADFFMGSGTTAVACKELNRNYIGFEIDKEFHKIAVDRVNGITASGQTSIFTNFEELD